jgi:protein-S-isoprenylcysteine O-methyltransferase Ste14
MRNIDIPPVWLVLFLALARAIAWAVPVPLAGGPVVGVALMLGGLGLLLAAVAQMMAGRTTVHPHGQPEALVTGGLFSLSRNPIYLADALILAGASLWWDGLLALCLVPLFMALITRRFIAREEALLSGRFGPAFAAYRTRTRRWL